MGTRKLHFTLILHSDEFPLRRPQQGDSNLQSTTCLLESLSSSTSIPGSIDLAKALLDVLQAVSYTHVPSRSDMDYAEQLLISTLESVVGAIEVRYTNDMPIAFKR